MLLQPIIMQQRNSHIGHTLKAVYIKPTYEIFARHLMAIRHQPVGESLDDFLHSLHVLSKDCNFKAVDAATYRDEAIRDSFITGIQSNHIRQRQLEKTTLDLKTMVSEARALDIAQKSSETYSLPSAAFVSSITPDQSWDNSDVSANINSKSNRTYWNCGNKRYNRSVECHKCNKICHFAKYCRSMKSTNSEGNSTSALTGDVLDQ